MNNNKYGTFLLPFAFGTLAAFANTSNTTTTTTNVEPDNTAVNKRDVKDRNVRTNVSNLTAQDQARGSDADVETTRKIRSMIVDDDSLSTYAKNVKIITLNGVVTLKGPVKNTEERAIIERHARTVARSANIQNQLEIAPTR